jgi:hypothetical protein
MMSPEEPLSPDRSTSTCRERTHDMDLGIMRPEQTPAHRGEREVGSAKTL